MGRHTRWWIFGLPALALLVLLAFAPFAWRAWVNWRYTPRIYTAEEVPAQRVAIVFGARVYPSGRLSAMLRDRVETAIDLYRQGKVQKILVSGDNHLVDYNEPGAMMQYALDRGVPAADIQPDYAGLRTYDTCYRASAIFQVEEAILITQAFHLPRALLLCSNLGLKVVGVAADRSQYGPRSVAWSESRETPALVAALVDLVLRQPPPILGEPIPIQ